MKRLSNINESHWSEMNRRSQGIKVRKEDDVDFLNGKDFADYLSKRYSFENEYKIEYDKTLNTLTIPVCTGYYDLSVDYTNDSSKILYICISKSILPEQVCSALKKKFKMRYGDSYVFLSPSDGGEPTNKFVVDILDYMADLNMDDINMRKSIKESHWSEMNRRSQGIQKRKEDDVDLLDRNGLYEYLKANYEPKSGYTFDDVITRYHNNSIISIHVYESKNILNGGTDLRFEFCGNGWDVVENNKSYAVLDRDVNSDILQVPVWLVEELEEFAVINYTYNSNYCLIYPKNGERTTNRFLLRVLDHIIERMESSVTYRVKLKKK